MIRVMDSCNKEPMLKKSLSSENCLDSQLWHACAGGMLQMPPLHSNVFYFPQGHAEHALGAVDFSVAGLGGAASGPPGYRPPPPMVLCSVSGIRYLADSETDDVFARVRLVPICPSAVDDDCGGGGEVAAGEEKPVSFVKTLTQSDANNGGGFSVPRYCAETIFPRLDYSAEPPVQAILAKDVHGVVWKFRHIYRGTPRRHLLTTGWSNFVNQKKLVAGDSIVFLRAENGDLCVGIRRAKKGIDNGHEYYQPFGGTDSKGRLQAEAVAEATRLAARGEPFEVVYYPRGSGSSGSTPEFCVRAAAVRSALMVRWCAGMRFKMPFETEDSSRISWFMGTVSSVQLADPLRWPDSPWRLLQVAWDEPDLLQNVKRVNPWLVELVANVPSIPVSPFSPPRKKVRLLQTPEFSTVSGQIPGPILPGHFLHGSPVSPFCSAQNSVPAGIQGARHAQFGQYPSDLHHLSELQPGLFPFGIQQLHHQQAEPPRNQVVNFMNLLGNDDNISCWLKMGHPVETIKTNDENEVKPPHLLLFGQVIFTEEQLSKSSSGENSSSEKAANLSDGSGSTLHQGGSRENSSDVGSPWYKDNQRGDMGLETGHCKVFIESDDVGRTLDLSVLGSYQDLSGKLADMFGIEGLAGASNVLYRDTSGCIKHIGDEPFSEFLKTARRLTIVAESGSIEA